jgi:hypothetical protein
MAVGCQLKLAGYFGLEVQSILPSLCIATCVPMFVLKFGIFWQCWTGPRLLLLPGTNCIAPARFSQCNSRDETSTLFPDPSSHW